MDERFKNLNIKLSKLLEKHTFDFLLENLKDVEDTSEVLNLILSSFMSAMFTMMRASAHHTETKKTVNDFMEETLNFMSEQYMIIKVECERVETKSNIHRH